MSSKNNYDPEYMGLLWYLDGVQELEFGAINKRIKAIEWEHQVHRIKAPHVKACELADADFPCLDGTSFRLLDDLFVDSIEVAARHVLKTYKQLPYYMSVEDSVYVRTESGLRRQYVWVVAVYGAEIVGLVERARSISDKITISQHVSAAQVKMANNAMEHPKVSVMKVVLIDGGIA